ncbi:MULTISPECIES: HAD family hydrolase [unclassified Virgibacillus]|uniref:HAD family hydrolase n=1 Tax=unclassified Virgibacillus TaxID=2620237 RepID=UPI00090A2598|nr:MULTISPECIES: HAD family hydrolase [unclassified Virgibacillus]API93356.1 hydrolase [Virgibacillus sp. 6R]MBS7428590.1 Cof-type HAD-IIB family hydrolase [Virgibacillus sp. 19R1-5]
MTYKTLFLDIDGTILTPDHTYTPSTKDTIQQVQKQGILVFICTGRPLHEVTELGEELGVDGFIGYNGAYAQYENNILVDKPMDQDTFEQFLALAKQSNHELVCYTKNKNYFTSLSSPVTREFAEVFQLKDNHLLTENVHNQILGSSIINVQPNQVQAYESLDPDFHLSEVIVNGISNCYDIIRQQVNKGEAIKKVLQYLAIQPEQAIAFGDGMNDKEMLQVVGEGFAMGNSNPELFAYAKHRTTSVEDSGIYNGLKQLQLVK